MGVAADGDPMRSTAADIVMFDRRVNAGAAWLDGTRHRWRTDVDPTLLDLMSFEHCVFGQLYGSYWLGQRRVMLDHNLTCPQAMQFCIDRGFILASSKGNTMDYRRLTKRWLQELE